MRGTLDIIQWQTITLKTYFIHFCNTIIPLNVLDNPEQNNRIIRVLQLIVKNGYNSWWNPVILLLDGSHVVVARRVMRDAEARPRVVLLRRHAVVCRLPATAQVRVQADYLWISRKSARVNIIHLAANKRPPGYCLAVNASDKLFSLLGFQRRCDRRSNTEYWVLAWMTGGSATAVCVSVRSVWRPPDTGELTEGPPLYTPSTSDGGGARGRCDTAAPTNISHVLVQFWASVCDAVPALNQH